MILGGGPNRIGQGIEFDYCCCHACFALRELGIEIDHGQLQPRDRLHRLRHHRPAVLRAADRSRTCSTSATSAVQRPADGVIVQFGGQTPLNLAHALRRRRRADHRHQRRHHRRRRGPRAVPAAARSGSDLKQPANGIARSVDEARPSPREIGYPVVVRPMLRARRPGDGDRLRRRAARPLHRRGRRRSPATPGADRPVPRRRHRGRRRRHLRRRATSSSPASWSTSRRPASTPATPPARCRPTRSPPRPSTS